MTETIADVLNMLIDAVVLGAVALTVLVWVMP